MEHLMEEAFRFALHTELTSYRGLRNAALMHPDNYARELLRELSAQQWEIVEEIARRCPEKIASRLMPADDLQLPAPLPYPREASSRTLYRQLRAALVDKQCSAEKYTIFAASFRDPEICGIFQLALNGSQRLLVRLLDAYRQADDTLHPLMPSMRRKRTHLRSMAPPSPNPHTELFISLLDSGRRSLS
ncbi:hypothetical protein L4X63_12640 [Geomonas sp. Red32]|uniref:hypothetical protein n=1 Tax=Geomonas sp. Red32 TaxID=2912856 RepID=UPI00202CFE81|nr:hypothetical protein [Geomonas sp. Red32]MCM0082438.1 hypothetical protein [Geomonas sp. Red32]